ncbi:MAG TPA: Rrf2 family transcriptional regulator [Albitalea sp.]|uniref:RrF2 family transcriptional regulator n=1 Tax=Piscinibacter sp. TaxID=1903157 RepID=UPI002ED1F5D6
MKLTVFTDYSLRVLLYLAAEPSRRATIAEIAKTFDISESHLTKVVHLLGRQGWIDTVRGKGGGIVLAKAPHDIRIGKVVRDTEGAAVPAECFTEDGGHCAIGNCCELKSVLAEAVAAFYAVLDHYTLADISRNRRMLGKVLMLQPA